MKAVLETARRDHGGEGEAKASVPPSAADEALPPGGTKESKGARGNHLAFAKVQSSNGSGSGALGDEWLAGLNISADGFLKKTPYVNAANKQKQKGKGKKQRRKGRN